MFILFLPFSIYASEIIKKLWKNDNSTYSTPPLSVGFFHDVQLKNKKTIKYNSKKDIGHGYWSVPWFQYRQSYIKSEITVITFSKNVWKLEYLHNSVFFATKLCY